MVLSGLSAVLLRPVPSFSDIVQSVRQGTSPPVPEEWKQGRTAYGGLSAGLLVEVAHKRIIDLPQLRSLQVQFTGPVTGDPDLSARLLRQGRNVTSVGAEASVEGKPVANALVIFGAGRESTLDIDDASPRVAAPEACELFMPPGTPFVPAFIPNFEIRFAGGQRPMAGDPEGRILAWVRHRDPADHDGESAFVCLGDVLPPAAFAAMRAPVPISSVNWQLNLLREPETREGWFLVESHQTAAREGYSSQRMRYWNTEGRLVAEGMQAVAVFG